MSDEKPVFSNANCAHTECILQWLTLILCSRDSATLHLNKTANRNSSYPCFSIWGSTYSKFDRVWSHGRQLAPINVLSLQILAVVFNYWQLFWKMKCLGRIFCVFIEINLTRNNAYLVDEDGCNWRSVEVVVKVDTINISPHKIITKISLHRSRITCSPKP